MWRHRWALPPETATSQITRGTQQHPSDQMATCGAPRMCWSMWWPPGCCTTQSKDDMHVRCRWTTVHACLHQATTRWDAEEMLAASYMEAAEIVFTTLSSTGRRAFERGRRFDLVLIDEAAQASEAATLQPLTLGSGKYVGASALFLYVCVLVWVFTWVFGRRAHACVCS